MLVDGRPGRLHHVHVLASHALHHWAQLIVGETLNLTGGLGPGPIGDGDSERAIGSS
jgi:hypothetical protein